MASLSLKDFDDIRAAVQLYIDGCANGSGNMMKPAFHENATINGAPIQTLFDGANSAGKADSTGIIDVIDITNDIAIVRVTLSNYFDSNYVDYHALKKIEGKWKIMAKIFTEIK